MSTPNECPTPCAPYPVALSITFNGPFLYDFKHEFGSRSVSIYAPRCPFHLAGIYFSLSSLSELDLSKRQGLRHPKEKLRREYRIQSKGITSYEGIPQVIDPFYPGNSHHTSLTDSIKSLPAGSILNPLNEKVLFKVSVPNPQYIFPIYYDYLEVVEGFDTPPQNNNITLHCTGLRFFYMWDARDPIQLVLEKGETFNIEPPIFREVPASGDIEIRYEGIGLIDENDPHADARSCFASLAALASVEWWLNYGDGLGSPTNRSQGAPHPLPEPGPCAETADSSLRVIHTGGDCHAPVIVNGLNLQE